MTTFIMMTLALSLMGGQAQTKEKKNKHEPASLSIMAPLDKIKAELIRERLEDGYLLDKDQPSQLTFAQPVGEKLAFFGKVMAGRGTSMKNMLQFTFAQNADSVTVYAIAWVAILNRNGIEEHPEKHSSKNNPALLKYLNKIKEAVE
jgi:hypothetical protein